LASSGSFRCPAATKGSLTREEQARIHAALINEAERLRNIAVEFGQTEPIASPVGAG
jgi:hypothetical protein